MDEIRRNHNLAKRRLIESTTKRGDDILDVGCGFGGDLQKWRSRDVRISMCDPQSSALCEAKARAKSMNIDVNFYAGDVRDCPRRHYDVICYNFSLQYIFSSKQLFFASLREIRIRIKRGGLLIGIIPDSDMIIFNAPFEDELGNFFKLSSSPNGNFGDMVDVRLSDTPYYANGSVKEPLAYKDLLVTHLEDIGFRLVLWERLDGHRLSEMYSKFIFTYTR